MGVVQMNFDPSEVPILKQHVILCVHFRLNTLTVVILDFVSLRGTSYKL